MLHYLIHEFLLFTQTSAISTPIIYINRILPLTGKVSKLFIFILQSTITLKQNMGPQETRFANADDHLLLELKLVVNGMTMHIKR